MSQRVLTTDQAREAINRFNSIINGPLMDQIRQLDQTGQTLSQGDVWDGPLATQFRSQWTETHGNLVKMQQSLDQLRSQIAQINEAIRAAGGA